MSQSKPLGWAAGLLCFSLFLYFWGLGRTPFYTKGEPREAVEVWEEVHNGEWVLPMRNGHDLPSKPPMFHWLAGGSSLLFGQVDEFAVRFPSAVLATLSVLLVFWLGLKKWGTSAGVFAAFMLATNFEWMRAATTARVDMTLTAFLIAAFRRARSHRLGRETPARRSRRVLPVDGTGYARQGTRRYLVAVARRRRLPRATR